MCYCLSIVDTAAEVSILSDRLFQQLAERRPIIRPITLRTAGGELSMQGSLISRVKLKLGTQMFKEHLYVAPITDDMLLGLDF